LLNEDIAEVLLDKRKGQTSDLLVDPQVKAELVQQFAARSIAGCSVSGKALAKAVNGNLKTAISDRAVRRHMKKLGLMEIKKSLPKLVKALKKLLTILDGLVKSPASDFWPQHIVVWHINQSAYGSHF